MMRIIEEMVPVCPQAEMGKGNVHRQSKRAKGASPDLCVSKADSPREMLVINPAVGCCYFVSGPGLPSQLQSVTALGQYQFILLDEQRLVCMNNLPRVAV